MNFQNINVDILLIIALFMLFIPLASLIVSYILKKYIHIKTKQKQVTISITKTTIIGTIIIYIFIIPIIIIYIILDYLFI